MSEWGGPALKFTVRIVYALTSGEHSNAIVCVCACWYVCVCVCVWACHSVRKDKCWTLHTILN